MSERGSAPAAENKMGTMPVGKLVFNMSLPMMVSMLVQALYGYIFGSDTDLMVTRPEVNLGKYPSSGKLIK